VIYLYLDRLGRWVEERRSRGRIERAELPLRSTSDAEAQPEFAGVDGENERLGF